MALTRTTLWCVQLRALNMSRSSATATLQHYMPAIYTILADVVLSLFLFGESVSSPRGTCMRLMNGVGSLTVLSMVSTAHLMCVYFCSSRSDQNRFLNPDYPLNSRRGVKGRSTAFMLGSVMVLYSSTAVYMGVQMADIVGYARVLNEAVAALSSEASGRLPVALTSFEQSARTKSHIISLVLAFNVTRFVLRAIDSMN